MNNKIPLVVIIGPTAVGKTSLSVKVAKRINGEIISADSMQIYKGMDIGTAKIKEEEMENIPHYLINIVSPDEEFTVSDFQTKAKHYINAIYNKGKVPMLVGGTGLYINSIVYDLRFTGAEADKEYRNKLIREAEIYGNEYLYNKLKEIDLESAERIHPNNLNRIIRALEVFKQTGKPMSYFYKNFREENKDYNLIYIGLNTERSLLYKNINKRVDIMIKEGLIDEVKHLLQNGYNKNLTSMQGLGYKEIIEYLEGDISLDEAIDKLKRDTRRFAKRQLTWFRRDNRIHWLNLDKFSSNEEIFTYVINYINSKINFQNGRSNDE